ncbi:MAG TPA: hypothetical protein VGM54_03495 [Chthoniobacter sp.]|jgi:hypothetical protein
MPESPQTSPSNPASEQKTDPAKNKEGPDGAEASTTQSAPKDEPGAKPEAGSNTDEEAEAAADMVVFPKRSEVFMALLITASGAIGGWFVGAVPLTGLTPANLSWWQRLLVGGVAAGVMVYYVAKSDRRRFWHCLVFAFLCGMIGQPLIVNTLNGLMPGGPTVASTTEALQQSSNAVAVAVGQQSAEQTTASLQEVEATAQKLVGAAKTAKNPDDKAKATEALSATVTQLGDSLPSTPEEARVDMIKTLTNLAANAYTNQDQKAALRAFEAIRPLADGSSRNTEVQAAAESAKIQLARMLGLTPSVSIEAQTGSNPEALGKIKQALVEAGYQVPSVENGGTARDKEAKLIYYTNGDQPDAENVVNVLRKYLGSITAVPSITTTPARPRQYQLQMGSEAFAAPQAAPTPTDK